LLFYTGNKDWKKIHNKNFEKFDSIDVYLDKKRKRAEELSASVKKARTLLNEVHTVVNKLKAHKTPQADENKVHLGCSELVMSDIINCCPHTVLTVPQKMMKYCIHLYLFKTLP